jgi:hypothetical protein
MRLWKGRVSSFGIAFLVIALLTARQLRDVVHSVGSVATQDLVGIVEPPTRLEHLPSQPPHPALLAPPFTNSSSASGTNAVEGLGSTNRTNDVVNGDSSFRRDAMLSKSHSNTSEPSEPAAKKSKGYAGRQAGMLKKPSATRKSKVKIVGPSSRSVNVTIVCQVQAELGNSLGHLAHCLGIQSQLASLHNLSSHLVVRNAGGSGGALGTTFAPASPGCPCTALNRGTRTSLAFEAGS